jgi:hypothetical protein
VTYSVPIRKSAPPARAYVAAGSRRYTSAAFIAITQNAGVAEKADPNQGLKTTTLIVCIVIMPAMPGCNSSDRMTAEEKAKKIPATRPQNSAARMIAQVRAAGVRAAPPDRGPDGLPAAAPDAAPDDA